ncbi:MAG: DUF2520 domain-containing protein [Flavobacteriales bacterium]|nr:DUF2520 domain-containing protein [Flavobacteriales bacterium]
MLNISFIGSGNVATHLANALKAASHNIVEVWSRNPEHAKRLAREVGAGTVEYIRELRKVDVIIAAVSDDALTAVSHLIEPAQLLVHTSGSVPLEALSTGRRGVFYPLQTFTRDKAVDMRNVPVCIEAGDELDEALLRNAAESISDAVHVISSEQRKHLHLAAVFACNFSNHLYRIAELILQDQDMELDLLKPLILETALKVQDLSPREAQTGPARRGDTHVLNSHLHLLKDPELRAMYGDFSERIIKDHDHL